MPFSIGTYGDGEDDGHSMNNIPTFYIIYIYKGGSRKRFAYGRVRGPILINI